MNEAIKIIKDKMKDSMMNQKELSLRCGHSQKTISKVLNGSQKITWAFASSLRYPLGINPEHIMSVQQEIIIDKLMKSDRAKELIKNLAARKFIFDVVFAVRNALNVSKFLRNN